MVLILLWFSYEYELIYGLDAFLASVIDLLPSSKYTVMYITTSLSEDAHTTADPAEDIRSASHFDWTSQHMELKRDELPDNLVRNGTLDNAPLFEKYQFLTPGSPSCTTVWSEISADMF